MIKRFHGTLERPLEDCKARIYTEANFIALDLGPDFTIHINAPDKEQAIELLKDFAQAMIGAVETAKEY